MAVDELGYGEVWSDLTKPIVHFGSPTNKAKTVLLDSHGKPIER
jgi:hypothetical protein